MPVPPNFQLIDVVLVTHAARRADVLVSGGPGLAKSLRRARPDVEPVRVVISSLLVHCLGKPLKPAPRATANLSGTDKL